MEDCISFDDGGALSVFHRRGKNVVAIIVVQDHQTVVASTGRQDGSSSLVSIDLSSGLCDGAVTFKSVGGVGRWSEIGGAVDRVISVWLDMGALSSGSLVFAGLVQVALGHGNGCRRKFPKGLSIQSREVGEIAIIQCLLQCTEQRREQRCMRKADQVVSDLLDNMMPHVRRAGAG